MNVSGVTPTHLHHYQYKQTLNIGQYTVRSSYTAELWHLLQCLWIS